MRSRPFFICPLYTHPQEKVSRLALHIAVFISSLSRYTLYAILLCLFVAKFFSAPKLKFEHQASRIEPAPASPDARRGGGHRESRIEHPGKRIFFQLFSNVSHHFSNIFERFRKFSNVFKRFRTFVLCLFCPNPAN